MTPSKEVPSEVTTLYSILNMCRIAAKWAQIGILEPDLLSGNDKRYLKIMVNNINGFHNQIFHGFPESDKAIWEMEFSNRDAEVLGSIFHELSQMDDAQRQVAEDVIIAIRKGEFKVELE
jgi:hypothetical protein